MAKLQGRSVAKLQGRWVAKLQGRWVAKLQGRWVAELIARLLATAAPDITALTSFFILCIIYSFATYAFNACQLETGTVYIVIA